MQQTREMTTLRTNVGDESKTGFGYGYGYSAQGDAYAHGGDVQMVRPLSLGKRKHLIPITNHTYKI